MVASICLDRASAELFSVVLLALAELVRLGRSLVVAMIFLSLLGQPRIAVRAVSLQ
jgi:hypothetical protein